MAFVFEGLAYITYMYVFLCIYKYGKILDTYREMSDGSNFSCHLHDGAHVLVTNGTRREAVERQMKIAKMIGNDQF